MKIIKSIYKWCTATRLRKILSSILALLILFTSIRYLFLPVQEVKAADIYLGLNEGYGTSASDTNSTVSAGTITGATWKTEDLCKVGKCLYFSGSGQYVTYADNANLDMAASNTVTVEAWFRTPAISSGTRTLVSKIDTTTGSDGGYKITMNSSGQISFGIDNNNTSFPLYSATSTARYDDNKWHQVAAVKNGTTSITLYIDAVQSATTSITSTDASNGDSFIIGRDINNTSNDWNGFVDELKVLRISSTQSQIQTDYLGSGLSITGASPIAWYRMDEASWTNDCSTATIFDSSGNGNDGKSCPNSTGPTGGATGKFNNAGTFDGSDDYGLVTDSNSLDLTNNFTITAWIKPAAGSLTTARYIVSKDGVGTDTTDAYDFYVSGTGSTAYLCYETNNRGTTICPTTQTIVEGTWQHVAIAFNNSDSVKARLYVNGVEQAPDPADSTQAPVALATNMLIGRRGDNATPNIFNGQLDDIRIYNYTRSQTQILEDMKGYPPSGISTSFGPDQSYLSNGLFGYWKMDEASWTVDCSTGSVLDSSGNGNNGASCPITTGPTGGSTGKFGYAGSFDGVNDYVSTVNGNSVKGLSQVTMSAWVNTNITGEQIIYSESVNASGNVRFRFEIGANNKVNIAGRSPDSDSIVVWATGNTVLSTGTWYFVTAVYDALNNSASIYINGNSDNQTTNTLSAFDNTNPSTLPIIGANPGASASFFNGTIDEIRMYNRALSPNEIQKLYNWAPGPIGYWKLDDNNGSTTTAVDSSGYGNNGTINNGGIPTDWVTGKYGSAYNFDTTRHSRITMGSPTLFYQLPVFTAEEWVYPRSKGDNNEGRFFDKTRATGPGNGWYFKFDTGSNTDLFFGVDYATTDLNINTNETIPLNQWSHVAVTWDGDANPTGHVHIFINGIEATYSGAQTGVGGRVDENGGASNAELKLGNQQGTNWRTFDGYLDDARIYNYARTGKQITEDMNAGHLAPGSPVGSATGYWKFDEGNNDTINNSGNCGSTCNLTRSGATKPSWSNSGKFGKALNYGGTAAYLAVGSDISQFKITSDLTLSAWINLTNISSQHDIICKYTGTAATSAYCLTVNSSGKLQMLVVNATGPAIVTTTGNTTLSTSTWYHVVGVFSNGSSVTLYVNGQQDTQNTTSIPTTLQNPTTILDLGGENAGSNLMNGLVDEAKVYNLALTSDQVKVEYNRGSAEVMGALSTTSTGASSNADVDSYCPPGQGSSCTAPIGEWKIDEGSWTVNCSTGSILDTSGSGYNLSSCPNSTGPIAGGTGKFGFSASLDGVDDYLQDTVSGNDLDFGSSDKFTITAWVKPKNLNSTNMVVSKTTGTATDTGYWVYLNNVGQITFDVGDGTHVYNSSADNNTVPIGSWTHIAVVFDHATNTGSGIYVNGIYATSSTASTAASVVSPSVVAQKFTIGRQSGAANYMFPGNIDNVRVYKYALTPSQIAWDYNHGDPSGWWKMDEGTGSTANDASGNSHNGTITIGATGSQTTTAQAWSNGVSGRFNSAINLDGTDDRIVTGSFLPFSTTGTTFTNLSWGGWLNSTSFASTQTFMEKATTFRLNINTSGQAVCDVYPSPTGPFTTNTASASQPAMSTSTWYNDVCTYDGSTIKLYSNGTLVDSWSQSGTISATNTALNMGQTSSSTQRFSGKIDDLRIYNYPLTATQIRTLYDENSAVDFRN